MLAHIHDGVLVMYSLNMTGGTSNKTTTDRGIYNQEIIMQ